jgi:hypothetical protein
MKKVAKLPNPFSPELYAKATKKRPISPQLDETAIIATLSAPCAVESAEFTRTASAMAILDAFDRKVLRHEAIIVFQAAIELNERMREAEMIARTLYDVGKGTYKFDPPETIETYKVVLGARLEMAEKARLLLLTQMKKIEQCPWDDDHIH